ncbi:hypothetical protein [Bdellovibrio sp. HCB337]|uniref:DUF7687 domain-containing protein n=1 Tax=Bdellovibrio sp. HCB337 TaxID=3394358 RepID=UPI0039A70A88
MKNKTATTLHTKYTYEHPFWDLVRYYASLGKKKTQQKEFLKHLESREFDDLSLRKYLSIDNQLADDLLAYIEYRTVRVQDAFELFRSEEEAMKFCSDQKFSYGLTQTKSKDHHQSSKALIAAVSNIASRVCSSKDISVETNPQERCVWLKNGVLHVSARNLDGAIPGTKDPAVVWEIKEYWGKTSGGSKMSDAVYECHLVGREIRDYEKKIGHKIFHVVFLDGKDQWRSRVSDVARFIDLESQGLIDRLVIGKMVETDWQPLLEKMIAESSI